MNSKHVLVSVVMPVHNSSLYISEAVSSIINQTYKNIELIIVDDCSIDDSINIAKGLLDKSILKYRVIKTPHKLGYGGEAAFNYALRYSKGEYIAKMDSDDISHPKRIEVQCRYLNEHKNNFLVGSNLSIIDFAGNLISYRKYPADHMRIVKEFYRRSCIANPSIMFKKSQMENFFYILNYTALNDYFTFFYYLKNEKIAHNIQDYLVKYRIHAKSTLHSNIKENWKINLKIKKIIANEKSFSPSFVDKLIVKCQTMLINLIPEKIFIWIYSFIYVKMKVLFVKG